MEKNILNSLKLQECEQVEDLPFLLRFGLVSGSNLPILLPIPWKAPLLVEYLSCKKKLLSDVIEHYLLQILLQSKPNLIKVILFDEGLSNNFSALDQIRLKTNSCAVEIINDTEKQKKKLVLLKKLARERKTILSQSGCSSWADFQKTNEKADPSLIICISDSRFIIEHDESYETLNQITEMGSRLGILIWNMLNVEKLYLQSNEFQQQKSFNNMNALKANSCQLIVNDYGFELFSNDPDIYEIYAEFNHLGMEFEKLSRLDTNSAVDKISRRYTKMNTKKGKDFIKVKIAEYQSQPFYFKMGEASCVYHGLIAGINGMGKSSLLLQIVTKACEQYSPQDLQFFLLDFKDGQSFKLFDNVAHIPVLHKDSEDHDAVIFYLELFKKEKKYRNGLFDQAGKTIDKISDYNEIAISKGLPKLPYWIMIVDEVHALFEDQELSKKKQISQLIKEVAKQGRSCGLHLLFATQTYDGVDIAKSAKNQFMLRIAFKLANSMDSRYLFDKENEACLKLSQGEIFYNDNCGEVESNKFLKLDKVDRENIDQRLNAIRKRYPFKVDARFQYINEDSNNDEDFTETIHSNVPNHWR